MSAMMPDVIATLGMGVEMLPKAIYVAAPDPQKPGFHLETDCGTVKIADDADHFVIYCDRSDFPDTPDSVIKVRADLLMPDGSLQFISSFTTCGGKLIRPNGQVETTSSWSVPSEPAPGRVVKVTAVILKDIEVSVGAGCLKVA